MREKREGALLLSPSRTVSRPNSLDILPFRMPATLQASLYKAIIIRVALRHSYPLKAFSHIPKNDGGSTVHAISNMCK